MSKASTATPSSARAVVTRILVANTGAFTVAFALWVIYGPTARRLGAELGADATLQSFVKAAPILIGALVRLPVGVACDRFGARLVFPLLLILGALGALWTSFATSYLAVAASSLIVGIVGGAFAAGVQSVSRATPMQRQGLALSLFGLGNVGMAITTLCAPALMAAIGWRDTFRLYAAACCVTALLYALFVRQKPPTNAASMTALLSPLRSLTCWRLGLCYMATLGAFVAVTLVLIDLYIVEYGMTAVNAGLWATTFTLAASLARIPGGLLSDRFGGRPTLTTIQELMLAGAHAKN